MITEEWLKRNDIGYLLRMGGLPDSQDKDNESEDVERLVRLGLLFQNHQPAIINALSYIHTEYVDADATKAYEALSSLPSDESGER